MFPVQGYRTTACDGDIVLFRPSLDEASQEHLEVFVALGPKLITHIRYKYLFQEEQTAKLRVDSCLQFKRHLEQVQGSLLERRGLR